MKIKRTNNIYHISKKKILINAFVIIFVVLGIGKIFYGEFLYGVFILPLSIPIILRRIKKISNNKKTKMEKQFKDMLISMADAIEAGYSVENAVSESYRDLRLMYGDNSEICIELKLMISRLKFNINIEKIFENFAQRTDIEYAKLFSQVFSVAKKTGGNMSEVIRNVADNIKQKEQIKEEINVIISAKRYEQKIMMIIPVFIIFYVNVASPGFLDVMYYSWQGKIIMTIFIACYIIAYLWSEKITEIKD